jgi:tetratricopeptide (TPR) repeat protein
MISQVDRYILAAKLHSYLNDHSAAVRVLSEGIEENPDSPHLYRHRGHFKISLREFDIAISDFKRAVTLLEGRDDEIEYYQAQLVPEMERLILGKAPELLVAPTAINQETLDALKDVYKGTLKSSTWYHFALAYYLQGEFATAAEHYRKTLEYCIDDDMRVATLDWLYMSLRRAGKENEAQQLLAETDTNMHINEPSYHRRMMMYKGQLAPDDLLSPTTSDKRSVATQGYGVGNWYLCNGETDKAVNVFQRVIAVGQKAAFGHLAAEVDLKRLGVL